jgi:hypothetical protein
MSTRGTRLPSIGNFPPVTYLFPDPFSKMNAPRIEHTFCLFLGGVPVDNPLVRKGFVKPAAAIDVGQAEDFKGYEEVPRRDWDYSGGPSALRLRLQSTATTAPTRTAPATPAAMAYTVTVGSRPVEAPEDEKLNSIICDTDPP